MESMKSREYLKKVDHREWLHIDSALRNSVILAGWKLGAGIISIYLITNYFTEDIQGFYYTFASMIAMQNFVEFGLNIVAVNYASHEWAKLNLSKNGKIEGDYKTISRLVQIGRYILRVRVFTSILFMLVVGIGGYLFLGSDKITELKWENQWLTHLTFSSIIFLCIPFITLLEGCNQVAEIARFNTYKDILATFIWWIAIILGAGLWAPAVYSMVTACTLVYYLLIIRRKFFRPFFEIPKIKSINWRKEIMPMQWKLSLQSLVGYLTFSLFTPVMFFYYGPIIAGQMGMTWQILSGIQSFSSLWFTTKIPKLGIMVINKDYKTMERLWRKSTYISATISILMIILAAFIITILNTSNSNQAQRFLSPNAIISLGIGAVFTQVIHSIAVYTRAHKREIFTSISVPSAILIGLIVWQGGMRYGPIGSCIGYLMITSLVTFPLVFIKWQRFKKARGIGSI